MCGRFTLRTPQSVLVEHFDLAARGQRSLPGFEARYNIAPTQEIAVIRANSAGGREVAMMRWGLVPSWSKEVAAGPPLINARAETLAEKPAFRVAFRRRRCLIPADGFYEWRNDGDRSKKQPFYIHRPDRGLFAFAGLWETWTSSRPVTTHSTRSADPSSPDGAPASRLTIDSCTIITTSANATLRELHERMPVVLARNDYQRWLDPRGDDLATLRDLLVPCPDNELVAEPVSNHVNRVANDDPRCIAVERTLFD